MVLWQGIEPIRSVGTIHSLEARGRSDEVAMDGPPSRRVAVAAVERRGARAPIVIVRPSIVESEEHARKLRLRSRRIPRLL